MDETRSDFYANAVNVSTSIYDVSLFFSIQSPVVIDKDSKPLVETSAQCNVRMSPQHAKALAALLAKHIKKYEEDHKMELPLQDDLAILWKEHIKQE